MGMQTSGLNAVFAQRKLEAFRKSPEQQRVRPNLAGPGGVTRGGFMVQPPAAVSGVDPALLDPAARVSAMRKRQRALVGSVAR
jgi:hypothetical protein